MGPLAVFVGFCGEGGPVVDGDGVEELEVVGGVGIENGRSV